MRLITLTIALMFFPVHLQAAEKSKTACFAVEGMTCAACSVTLKAAVNKLKGIATVKASVEDNSATVDYDSKSTNSDEIKKAIDSTGYKATAKQCNS